MALNDFYTLTACLSSPQGPFSISQAYELISGTTDEDSADQALTQWETNNKTELLDCLSVDVQLDELRWEPAPGVNEVPGFHLFSTDVGTILFPAAPLNVAAVISQLTNAPNSNANGRLFMAGMSETFIVDGILTVAATAIYQLFADSLEGNLSVVGPPAAEYTPVVISRFLNGAPRIPPVGHAILSMTAKRELRQQRRRTTRRLGMGS